MSRRSKTPSYVAEFPLHTSPREEQELSIRLDAARQIYNASLGESVRRLALLRESKEWQHARSMPQGPARQEAFQTAARCFGFGSGEIQKFAERCRDGCWIGDHLFSHDTQTTSLRAFRAVQQYSFGKRGRPRFKGKRGLRSVEGKSDAVLYFRRDPVPTVHWAGLALLLVLDPRDKDGWEAQALSAPHKHCRILRRSIRGRDRWFVQLVQEGLPPRKERLPLGVGVVGIDLGPSTVAVVSETEATLETFCPKLKNQDRRIRRLRRAMDRSRQATNPGNYNGNGTVKKGKKTWVKSGRYLDLRTKVADLERSLAEERKRAHGELSNRILSQGSVVRMEKLSYKGFQRRFGRSVKRRAPGHLVSMLRRKAESAGGKAEEFGTVGTKLSQFDHKSGTYVKKLLNQRWHVFRNGSRVQRDLYSAWLARFVKNGTLDTSGLEEAWTGAEPLLRRAVSGEQESASGPGFPCVPRPGGRRSGSSAEGSGVPA